MSLTNNNGWSFSSQDFSGPTERMTGLPNIAYMSHEFAKFERDHVLAKTWFCAGNVAQLPANSWLQPVDILDLPLLIVRTRDGEIRTFHNVCSHRGMKLVQQSGRSNGIITCPYHSWCYGEAGELRSTPHVKGEGNHNDDRLDKSLHGLKEVRSHIFAGLIFVNISGDAPAFETFIEPVTSHWHEFNFDLYHHGGEESHWEITLEGNWKFAQENHVDGYHLPFVHPDLNSYSPLRDHYPLVIEGSASGQGTICQAHGGAIGDGQRPPNPYLGEPWQRGRSEFLSVFPNVMIGVHSDHIWTVHLIPTQAGQTNERMDLHYFGEGATSDRFADLRRNNRDRMLEIFEEDRAMVEGMQRGRQSTAFDGGALAPEMDQPAHCFNKIAASAIIQALDI